jgi:hypothetical protein
MKWIAAWMHCDQRGSIWVRIGLAFVAAAVSGPLRDAAGSLLTLGISLPSRRERICSMMAPRKFRIGGLP